MILRHSSKPILSPADSYYSMTTTMNDRPYSSLKYLTPLQRNIIQPMEAPNNMGRKVQLAKRLKFEGYSAIHTS
jgi:hypothetical protein